MKRQRNGLKVSNILVIGGSDPCSGAGIQADIKTLSLLGFHSFSVVTVITVQNSFNFYKLHPLSLKLIEEQLKVVLEDSRIEYVKTGILYSSKIVNLVAKYIKDKFVIVDPVFGSTLGGIFVDDSLIESYIKYIFPYTYLLTPNIQEAEIISERKIKNLEDLKKACIVIKNMGVENILIKGGHFKEKVDVLYDGENFTYFKKESVKGEFHGTGCVFSSFITGYLVKYGNLKKSIKYAKKRLTSLLKNPKIITGKINIII